ncbi:MAG: NADP-dependent malic enzyme [Thaumarchaeota archaeon]|nr:NADP-dependent malic enzyme [Nitrososphaerota archaeon]
MIEDRAVELHRKYGGKIQVIPKVPIKSFEDFSIWYTPGVASPCRLISLDKDLSFELTSRWNMVAVVSDGSRVLGLGNIGPYAGYPVIEGKCLLFKFLGGVDAVPIALATQDADKIIEMVRLISPSFGGINLEDIESPKCFQILETLQKSLEIPVWHDDQQGTSLVVLAALINALKIVGKKLEEAKITIIGSGAAGMATARLLMETGVSGRNMLIVDSKGILSSSRHDMEKLSILNPWKAELARMTNPENKEGSIEDALKGSDVLIALSVPKPGTVKKEWISKMAGDPIVFALANPLPEIWPEDAKAGGARIVATGRSDFPNQVNNSLAFPSMFRGVLTVRSRAITNELCIEGARSLARYAESKRLSENSILPTMDDYMAYVEVARNVARKAIELNLARRKYSDNELYDAIHSIIAYQRVLMRNMIKSGLTGEYQPNTSCMATDEQPE